MHFAGFLDEVQKLITAFQQGDLFGDKATLVEKSAEVCVEFLKGQGYSIGLPNSYPAKIIKPDELIAMFYGFVRDIYPKHLWSCSNGKRDRAIAKAFIERRMKEDNIDRKTAMNQCAFIIQTIFKRPDIFKFETPPTFGVLGQGEMGWLTERAVQLINKQVTKNEAIAVERAVDEMTKRIEETQIGYSLEELEAIRKKLEAKDGKKEKR